LDEEIVPKVQHRMRVGFEKFGIGVFAQPSSPTGVEDDKNMNVAVLVLFALAELLEYIK